jgi:hypothetical protein
MTDERRFVGMTDERLFMVLAIPVSLPRFLGGSPALSTIARPWKGQATDAVRGIPSKAS